MRDFLAWNISLGRWGGVHVRLHAFFLLLVAVALHLASQPDGEPLLGYTLLALGVLFASVLAHEVGHVMAARRIGNSSADQILLWPLGGLVPVSMSHDPEEELLVAAAGPAVNLLVCIVCVPLLLIGGATTGAVASLFNPLVPPAGTGESAVQTALELAVWINCLLFLINMLPAFPLDGGQLLRALLWRKTGFRTAVALVSRAARLTAVVLLIAAWLVHSSYPFASLPLALIGILLFFSGRQEHHRAGEHDADELPGGYDFSQGYTSLERQERQRQLDEERAAVQTPTEGWLRRWLREREEARLRRQQEIEAEEERRADEILARLHAAGMDALSPEDRALLDRVSERYRNRTRQ